MRAKSGLPEEYRIKHLLLPSAVLYMGLVSLLPTFGHAWDTSCWGLWATEMKRGGLVFAYSKESSINYLPLYLYVIKFYSMLFSPEQIYHYLHWLKAVTLLFDFGSILLLCKLIKPTSRHLEYLLFGIFNIGFFYNTLIWNQVDGILAFFILASFYTAFKNRLFISVILYLLALNFKLQGIVFLPIMGLLWLPHLSAVKFLKIAGICLLLELIIVFPFLGNGNGMKIITVAFGSVDYYKSISMNAFNIWYLFMDGDLMQRKDDVKVAGLISYKNIGLILFFISSAIVLVPLYFKTIQKLIRRQQVEFNFKLFVLAMALIGSFFYYFNTQMHERYIHPVIIFSTALAFLYRHWGQWIVFSFAYALSLESICKFYKIPNYNTLIFNPKFLAVLFTIGILMLLRLWYKTMKEEFSKDKIFTETAS